MGQSMSERERHTRLMLERIVAILEHRDVPEGVRLSLEEWAKSLRAYLRQTAAYSFVVRIPEPSALELIGKEGEGEEERR